MSDQPMSSAIMRMIFGFGAEFSAPDGSSDRRGTEKKMTQKRDMPVFYSDDSFETRKQSRHSDLRRFSVVAAGHQLR